MQGLLKKDKGFTLIEIVIVLAIAALIMVIVFLAIGGAQRARRNTARVNDVGQVAAAMEQYASNNNGAYLAAPTNALLGLNANVTDPSSNLGVTTGPAPAANTINATNDAFWVSTSKTCPAVAGGVLVAGGARNYAIQYGVENSGAGTWTIGCKDNS
jgi:prepilin-type N-terminal cleavage/methylation domain-containing protein